MTFAFQSDNILTRFSIFLLIFLKGLSLYRLYMMISVWNYLPFGSTGVIKHIKVRSYLFSKVIISLKMTLIIFIPFNEGVLLMGDKQNTYLSAGTREPLCKIDLITDEGPVIAGAGSTNAYRATIHRLSHNLSVNHKNIAEKFLEKLKQNYDETLRYTSEKLDVTALTVGRVGANIIVKKIEDYLIYDLDTKKCCAIGSGVDFISPQLKIDTINRTKSEVIKFGLTLIKYASYTNNLVSAPETYGCDYTIINNDGPIEISCIIPELVKLDPLLYKFEEETKFGGDDNV